jgi:hypothetical protein
MLNAMLRKSHIFPFLISFIIIVSFIGFAQAAATFSFWVEAGEDVSRMIDLSVDDRVGIKFSTVWAAEANTIGFSIVSPNGTIANFGEQGAFSFNFVCTEKGQYTLHFVNQDNAERKLVTLEVGIEHYIFGMTTTLFWLALIAVVCIAGAILAVLLTKTS